MTNKPVASEEPRPSEPPEVKFGWMDSLHFDNHLGHDRRDLLISKTAESCKEAHPCLDTDGYCTALEVAVMRADEYRKMTAAPAPVLGSALPIDEFLEENRHILELLFEQDISIGKAIEALREISEGKTPRLPELRSEEPSREGLSDWLLEKLTQHPEVLLIPDGHSYFELYSVEQKREKWYWERIQNFHTRFSVGEIYELIRAALASHSSSEGRECAELLNEVYDLYEDGDDCYEDVEGRAGYIGKAIRLSEETENRIIAVLNKVLPRSRAEAEVRAPQEEKSE